MKTNKKWIVLVMIMAMLLTLVPTVQAEEAIPSAPTVELIPPGEPGEAGLEVQPEDISSVPEGKGVLSAVYGPQLELRNLALGLDYEWSQGPEASHPDDSKKLTDGIRGELDITDPAWVGHVKKMTREVIFDLGEPKSISNIKARFLQDWPAKSLVPLTVSMYVSDDKENWGTLSHNATQLLWGDGPPREEIFEWDGSRDGIRSGNLAADMAYARYVKVTFTMHTRAWTFIDEIEITGADGKIEGAVTVPAEQPAFLEPGEATAGIHNLGLLYNGHYPNDKGTWTKDRIIPNISYVDQAGEPKDILFDGVVYLGLDSPNGRAFDGNANPPAGARLEDWNWYLDKTFADTGDMHQLNEATKEVGVKLGRPDFKEKVVLMIPNPGEFLSDFGVINGEALSFSASDVGEEKAFANREKAIQWWVNEVFQRWQAKNYAHLELVGMYWLEEQIGTSDKGPDLVLSTSRMVHDHNLKFFWIPHFLAYKAYMWKDVGIDAVAFQPNYFFEEMDYDRLEDAANLAKQYGMSNELEFDDRMLTDAVFRERYIDYLNSGVETGLMQNGFKAYYQGNDAVRNTAVSTDPATRILYDWLYQFVKGTYQINNGVPPEAVVKMNGQTLQSGAVVPETEPVQFTWEVKDDDGSGLVKVSATFNGKPYTAGTAIDLAGKPGKHELVITVAAGKSQKTTYIIEASTNADGLKTWVNRFAEEQQITNAEAVRSLNNHLEMMKRYEGVDEEQAQGYLKSFNAKLDQLKKDQMIKDGAYSTLKEGVYYLIGNVAANKLVEASSVEGGNSNYAPQKAVDGFPATRWASDYTNNSWFLIDLGEAKTMDTVRIDWEYARAKTYRLLISDDKQNWTNMINENNGIVTAHDGKQTVQFEPVKARYVKFEGIERATDYGYSFYEFGVYNLSGGVEPKAIDGVKAVVDAPTKKVTIDGLVMNGNLEKVNLKVVNPKGKVHYEAQTTSTEAGTFQFAFSLNGGVEGTYTANLATGDMNKPETITFVYKRDNPGGPGNGGNNGNGGNGSSGGASGGAPVATPPTPELFQTQADGSVKAVLGSKLEADGKTAAGMVSEPEMRKALAQAKADQEGKQRIIVELKKQGEASNYALDLPAAFLSGNPNLLIEMITPKALVILNGQMLGQSTESGKQFRFSIQERAPKSLTPEALAKIGNRPMVQLEVKMDGKSIPWKNEKAPIAVAIPYAKAGHEIAARIGILSVNESGTASDVKGAAYSASDKLIRFQANRTGTYAAYAAQSAIPFTDLDSHSWAREAVDQLTALGIVQGTSATTFSPAEQVSRGDFILMLVRTLELQAEATEAFSDVQPKDYYYEAVSAAKQLGVVNGTLDGRIEPKARITRQDMMVMAARALKAAQVGEISGDRKALDGFKDGSHVSDYAADSIAGMIEKGLIQGDGKTINPQGHASRAETAVFLNRLLELLSE